MKGGAKGGAQKGGAKGGATFLTLGSDLIYHHTKLGKALLR